MSLAEPVVPPDWVPVYEFADRLVVLRHKSGRLSQEAAATTCGINPKTWATWELGSKPRDMASVVEQIHRGLGANREWLMWGAGTSSTCSSVNGWLGLIQGDGPEFGQQALRFDRSHLTPV